jgi:L-alanine-DL-glutamate epimerase-like enolase superfamily enzyme
MMRITARIERWPIAGAFNISRGTKTEAVVVVAEVHDGSFTGRGECVPYARYGETPETTMATIEALDPALLRGGAPLRTLLPAGAARNAVDCALIDLEAKREGRRAWQLLGQPNPQPCTTAYTLSLGTAAEMAKAAEMVAHRPLLKIKLGTEDDRERLRAIRAAAPQAELIVDANEGWRAHNLELMLEACAAAGVTLVEQPLPADDDAALATIQRPVAVCADESAHDRGSLSRLAGRYDAVNIKLDKTGGLTEALAMAEEARALGLDIMVGCMVGTSLAMAPGMLLAPRARYVDLDGPLLLQKDRPEGLIYDGSTIYPPDAALWG